ncbi:MULTISPECIES: N-6 DNA methylase [Qipengyuania]|uniref:class I SAM-dependent DNA methyltransferase n=1 Tax=Qipengyuania TaxID=1855416 RepID=UPI002A18CE17|nr:N-6 DNA methylase [Qipengyuania sp. HL-TH1]WPL57687.1 N-6 DNA methylase [Qipengyuania sp. HL-TH5]
MDSIIKSARKIMRKDKGLNGDLDRLPMLTWIMFLKFLDDMELIEEEKAEMSGKRFRGAIEAPYRWRDWAADEAGITGPDLLHFLTAEEAELPDGSTGPGLFAYLKGLRGDNGKRDRKDVVATVFRGLTNRMESGYLLRDVINLVHGIHFDSSEEVHTLGRLYETLLREMRDAAGDSGEFYTPRPIVRFMVQVTDPKIGEKVLDPACGTGGFLTEAFTHMADQANTVEKHKTLQESSIFGGEAKSLPFLLVQMNLLLHGLEAPQIDPGNSLSTRLAEIGEADRFEVILSNPPFGGEEETGILNNFPEDRRTTETALLFLQMIMRRLKRRGKGRAAVVVPHGVLFGTGIAARIKADLIREFNLHTVLRLPEGVFAPYTDIPTNVIFFDTAKATGDIWYYEQPKPEGRKKYSKTAPLTSPELQPCLDWWSDRTPNEQAWKIKGTDLIETDEAGRVVACNLDQKNPNAGGVIDHRTPLEIVDSISAKEERILGIVSDIKRTLAELA